MLTDLQTLEREDLIDVFYDDESGFSPLPVVPYGRFGGPMAASRTPPGACESIQPWAERAGLVERSRRVGEFYPPQSIDTAFVIACINAWVSSLTRETVLVLDNAPVHQSKAFKACLAGWQQQGLYGFMLPAYSPHLNKVEWLWRKMKYEWLTTAAYTSYEALRGVVQDILARFGQPFKIQFTP